jgi:protein gp37
MAIQSSPLPGVPFFFKQWGGFHPKANGSVLDGREWKEFPR